MSQAQQEEDAFLEKLINLTSQEKLQWETVTVWDNNREEHRSFFVAYLDRWRISATRYGALNICDTHSKTVMTCYRFSDNARELLNEAIRKQQRKREVERRSMEQQEALKCWQELREFIQKMQ